MAVNPNNDDFFDFEEPKSPTLSCDVSVLLSESNVPLPYPLGVRRISETCSDVSGVSPELFVAKHNPKILPEKGAGLGGHQMIKLPSASDSKTSAVEQSSASSRRIISIKTPKMDLNLLRVRRSDVANPASLEMRSSSKGNTPCNLESKDDSPAGAVHDPQPNLIPSSVPRSLIPRHTNDQGKGERFGHQKSAVHHAARPPLSSQLNNTGDPSKKCGFTSLSVDNCDTVDIVNAPTIDIAMDNFSINQQSLPSSKISNGEKSGSSIGSNRSTDEKSKVYINVHGEPYQVIRLLGEGGSSKVFEVFSNSLQLMAIKCVNLVTADESICESYRNEISVLSRLQGSDRVIKLYNHEFNEKEKKLYVVLERGDIDLASFLASNTKLEKITPEMIKFYWSEMLRAVEVIHKAGIIHSDLKPANFLLVAGQLKLIDFGIASTIPTDATSIIKDSRSGTPSYMSPEAFLDTREDGEGSLKIKIGVKSDVWSLGIILYHLVYKCTPFHHIRDPMKKMLSIVNPNHKITFAPLNDLHLLDVLKRCIVRDPKQRASIHELLEHPYLTATSRLQHPLASLMNSISELSPTSIQRISQVVGEMKKK